MTSAMSQKDRTDSDDLDVLELMSGMVAEEDSEKECLQTFLGSHAKTELSHGRIDEIELDCDTKENTKEDEACMIESCSTFWQRSGSTPALVDSLSRTFLCLHSLGFALPWYCPTCSIVNASWFGQCQDCKSSNAAYEHAVKKLLEDDVAIARDSGDDHVLLVLSCREGANELEACFLMCEAIASTPEKAMPLYRRAFRLWPALDSHIYPDGVPQALRSDADIILASRNSKHGDSGSCECWGIFPPDWQSPLDVAMSCHDSRHTKVSSEDCINKVSDTVVVYSYHQEEGDKPGSWWQQALRSASGLKAAHEDHLRVALHVICNVDVKTYDECGVFDEHILGDLAKEAALPKKGRALCGTKIQAIIHCLERGYQNVIYMDSDTHILRPFLSPMLAALQFYDLTGVFEGPPVGMAQTGLDPFLENPRNQAFGYELNTGVLGVRLSALELCHAWLSEYRSHVQKYASVSSADQPALMQVLRCRSERVFPLPPIINFRPYTVFSPSGPSVPAIIHDHHHDVGHAHEDIINAVSNHMQYGLRWK